MKIFRILFFVSMLFFVSCEPSVSQSQMVSSRYVDVSAGSLSFVTSSEVTPSEYRPSKIQLLDEYEAYSGQDKTRSCSKLTMLAAKEALQQYVYLAQSGMIAEPLPDVQRLLLVVKKLDTSLTQTGLLSRAAMILVQQKYNTEQNLALLRFFYLELQKQFYFLNQNKAAIVNVSLLGDARLPQDFDSGKVRLSANLEFERMLLLEQIAICIGSAEQKKWAEYKAALYMASNLGPSMPCDPEKAFELYGSLAQPEKAKFAAGALAQKYLTIYFTGQLEPCYAGSTEAHFPFSDSDLTEAKKWMRNIVPPAEIESQIKATGQKFAALYEKKGDRDRALRIYSAIKDYENAARLNK